MKKNQKKRKKVNAQKLLAKTRVVELKPKHKYLIMFDTKSGCTRDEVASLMFELADQKVGGIGLYLKDLGGVEIYEKQPDK
jgi:uncharacterized protein (DUF779 family)